MNLNMCFVSVLSLSPECDYRSCHMVLGCFLGAPLCFLETIYPLSSTRKARRHLRVGTLSSSPPQTFSTHPDCRQQQDPQQATT